MSATGGAETPPRLTAKQAVFVREYLVDLNATAAARRAGYSARTADRIGPELLGKTCVATAIRIAQAERAARLELTADRVAREIALVAFGDPRQLFTEAGQLKPPHEWTAEQAALIASVEVAEELGERTVTKVKRWDKVKALGLLARHLGMFTDRVEVTTKAAPEEDLTDADLDERIRRLAGSEAGAAPAAGGAEPAGGPA